MAALFLLFSFLLGKTTHQFLVCSPSCATSVLILHLHTCVWLKVFGPLWSSSLNHRSAEWKGPLDVIQSNLSFTFSSNNICVRTLGASMFFTKWQHVMKNPGYLQLCDPSNLKPRLLYFPVAVAGCQAFQQDTSTFCFSLCSLLLPLSCPTPCKFESLTIFFLLYKLIWPCWAHMEEANNQIPQKMEVLCLS